MQGGPHAPVPNWLTELQAGRCLPGGEVSLISKLNAVCFVYAGPLAFQGKAVSAGPRPQPECVCSCARLGVGRDYQPDTEIGSQLSGRNQPHI